MAMVEERREEKERGGIDDCSCQERYYRYTQIHDLNGYSDRERLLVERPLLTVWHSYYV